MQLSPNDITAILGILTILSSGAVGAMGLGTYFYLTDRVKTRRLDSHLQTLQRLVNKLLSAFDLLLDGETPEDTYLYQRFKAYGGEYYPELQAKMIDDLQTCQLALQSAFELHQKLLNPDELQPDALEQQLWQWEMLYATLVGYSSPGHNLTEQELTRLLDPALTIAPEVPLSDDQLATQLDSLQREFAELPLQLEWRTLKPQQVDRAGMLGHLIDMKDRMLALETQHTKEAPRWLKTVQSERQQAEKQVPTFLAELYHYISGDASVDEAVRLTKLELFAHIDEKIMRQAEAAEKQTWLSVIDEGNEILRDLEVIQDYLRGIIAHGRRRAKINTLTEAGYQPPDLADDLQAIEIDIQAITSKILAGDYQSAAQWIKEFNTDSQLALADTQTWHELYNKNVADIEQLQNKITRVAAYWDTTVAPHWEALQRYPRENWANIAPETDAQLQSLTDLRDDRFQQIKSLNSLAVQKLPEADQMLTNANVDLAHIERQGHIIVNRLTELRVAEQKIEQALQWTEADLRRAIDLRDREDPKIGPEIDEQLTQAEAQFQEAKRLAAAKRFIEALALQAETRHLATATYVEADEQVREINQLETALNQLRHKLTIKLTQCEAEAHETPIVAQTVSTNRLRWQLQDRASEAEQLRIAMDGLEDRALVKALETTITAYTETIQLADWTKRQLVTDHTEYEAEHYRTTVALTEAEAMIHQADHLLANDQAPDAAHHALQRAHQVKLPQVESLKGLTLERLLRIQRRATEATQHAERAIRQAHHWQDRVGGSKQKLQAKGEATAQSQRQQRLQALSATDSEVAQG
ncbi:MAG: hypothetical protein AAF485_06425 [Chloroflexota bacterium]